jgi:hypothetical protein
MNSIKAPLQSSSWVWYPEGNPLVDAPVETIYLRKTIQIQSSQPVKDARFVLSADNEYALFVNGKKAAANPGVIDAWRQPDSVKITEALKTGDNLFAVAAKNTLPKGPAGLIGAYTIEFADGSVMSGSIDASWKVTRDVKTGWNEAGFDESGWLQARVIAPYGGGPWGKIGLAFTASPVKQANPFEGTFNKGESTRPERVFLVMDGIEPEAGACVTVNGIHSGGMIGKPFQLEITEQVHPGTNSIRIEPFAPASVRVIVTP